MTDESEPFPDHMAQKRMRRNFAPDESRLSPQSIALKRIEEAHKHFTPELDLSNLGLMEVPDSLRQLHQLRVLDLSGNRFSRPPNCVGDLPRLQTLDLSNSGLNWFPDELERLFALQTLDLSHNRLAALPDAIGNLSALQHLNLGDNQLTALPDAIGNLSTLQSLYLHTNELAGLPDAIGNLSALQLLDLAGNQLSALPDAIGQLAALRSLDLGHNQLTALPDAIGCLFALHTLHLGHNQLAALPESLAHLTNLQNLSLYRNQLAALPESLLRLTRLRHLFLHENEKLQIPPEILGGGGRDGGSGRPPAKPVDILAYYFRNRAGPTRPLHEAKLLIVGQGEVGKTSLVRFLVDNLACDQFEAQTDGIAIRGWQVQAAPKPRAEKQTVRVNVWDFGGQEIMHATHQFFLTHRSLYVLVLSARQGEAENNLHYWLKCIQSYGGQSPVLVVVNKSEGQNHLELDERRLLADYQPNLVGFLRISCKKKTGRPTLLREIQKQIGKLPHVFDPVPADFFAVKEGLAELAKQRDFLDYTQYESLCEEKRVRDKGDQQRLIRFLHDLGAALYFNDPDNPLRLSDTHVLNPEWVTGGVYRIITSPLLRDAKGKLDAKTLTEILNDARYPPRRHRFLLELMEKFDIGFEIPDSHGGRWLVPGVLPKDEPAGLEWNAPGLLHFELHYDILPSGFVGRFIVRMQRHVIEPYWRNGAVLAIGENNVLLRADADKSRILIRVGGPANGRRDALAVVRNAFESLRATFPRLEVKERVPLPDNPDVTVGYQHLRDMEAKREIIYWPEGASHRYRIAELLDGIDPPDRRQADADRGRAVNIHIGDKTVEVDGDVIGSTIDQGLIDGDIKNRGKKS